MLSIRHRAAKLIQIFASLFQDHRQAMDCVLRLQNAELFYQRALWAADRTHKVHVPHHLRVDVMSLPGLTRFHDAAARGPIHLQGGIGKFFFCVAVLNNLQLN